MGVEYLQIFPQPHWGEPPPQLLLQCIHCFSIGILLPDEILCYCTGQRQCNICKLVLGTKWREEKKLGSENEGKYRVKEEYGLNFKNYGMMWPKRTPWSFFIFSYLISFPRAVHWLNHQLVRHKQILIHAKAASSQAHIFKTITFYDIENWLKGEEICKASTRELKITHFRRTR